MIRGPAGNCVYCGQPAVKLRRGFCSDTCEAKSKKGKSPGRRTRKVAATGPKIFVCVHTGRVTETPFVANGLPYIDEPAWNAARALEGEREAASAASLRS